jgi:hypothetical protein
VALLTSMVDPSRKDVVVAIMGASAALGGFVLVFLGQLVSAYQSYPADTPKSVKDRRRGAIWPVLAIFFLSVATIAAAFIWLAVPGGTCFYRGIVVTFAVELAAIAYVAAHTAVRMVR